jgi:hypothetical protein
MEHILQKSRKEQIAYWVGELCMAIGQGKFNDMVSFIITFYQKEAYERGVKDGKAELASMF